MFEVWIYSAKLIVEDSNSITMCILDNKFSIFCEKFMRKILFGRQKKRYIKREIDERDRRHRIIKLDKFGEEAREKLILKTDFINNGLTEKEFKNFEHVMIKISKAML